MSGSSRSSSSRKVIQEPRAATGPGGSEHPQSGVAPGQLHRFGRGVVDNDDLNGVQGLGQCAVDRHLDAPGPVPGGDDDGDFGLRHGPP
jgi:hypothetical protein